MRKCIDNVEPRECKDLEGTLFVDVRDQVGEHRNDQNGEGVPGHLQHRGLEAGEQRKEAVEPSRFVDEKRKGDEFGARLEGDDAEECLHAVNGWLATPLTNVRGRPGSCLGTYFWAW